MIEFTHQSAIQFKQDTIHFNGGELHPTLRWHDNKYLHRIEIFAMIKSSNDLMELLLVKDAIDRMNTSMQLEVRLHMPYIPYARQDRVANEGEALGLKVVCDLINNLKFDRVLVADAHSPVSLALLERSFEEPQEELLRHEYDMISRNAQDIVLAPDAGALKKAEKFAERTELPLLTATKSRNTLNGELSAPSIQFTNQLTPEYVKNRIAKGGRIIVVDDICDGGGTFMQLGKALAGTGVISHETFIGKDIEYKGAALLVTHGIFAREAKIKLNKYFEHVSAYYDWTQGE